MSTRTPDMDANMSKTMNTAVLRARIRSTAHSDGRALLEKPTRLPTIAALRRRNLLQEDGVTLNSYGMNLGSALWKDRLAEVDEEAASRGIERNVFAIARTPEGDPLFSGAIDSVFLDPEPKVSLLDYEGEVRAHPLEYVTLLPNVQLWSSNGSTTKSAEFALIPGSDGSVHSESRVHIPGSFPAVKSNIRHETTQEAIKSIGVATWSLIANGWIRRHVPVYELRRGKETGSMRLSFNAATRNKEITIITTIGEESSVERYTQPRVLHFRLGVLLKKAMTSGWMPVDPYAPQEAASE